MRRRLRGLDVAAGEVVSIRFGGVLRHYGVVTHRGTVISNSRRHGGVVEQEFEDFGDGKSVRRHGAWSGLHPLEVEARARRRKHAPYDLFQANCGHFARDSHGLPTTPLQRGAAALSVLGALAWRSLRR